MTTLGGPSKQQQNNNNNITSSTTTNNGTTSPSTTKKKPNRSRKQKPGTNPKKKTYVVKTHRDNDMSSEEEEEEEEYKRGGYHPVEIGNVFNSRYRVITKLGWGHFSTVWLTSDSMADRPVALKIVKSAQHYTEAARDEIKILQKTTQEDPNNDSCVIHLLDHFEVCGINGNHVAMAFEKLGCNLLTLIRLYKYKGLPLPLVRMMAKQIIVGVEFLHRCQIIHTDLKPENLLMVKTPLILNGRRNLKNAERAERGDRKEEKGPESGREESDSMDAASETAEVAEKMEGTELSEKTELPRTPAVDAMKLVTSKPAELQDTNMKDESPPKSSITTDGLPWSNEELLRTFGDCYKIKIVDLGNACWTFKHFTDDVQTRQYRAPEVILGAKYDTAIDVWSVACIVFELLTGDLLFEPKAGKSFEKNDDHLAQMQELLGRMPRHVALAGKYTRVFFTRRGELRFIKNLKFWQLKDVLVEKYKFSEKESQQISDFLLPMLNMAPRERATAQQMLSHPWIRDVDINDFTTAFK